MINNPEQLLPMNNHLFSFPAKGIKSGVLLMIALLVSTGIAFSQSPENGDSESLFSDLSFSGYFENQTAYRLNSPMRFTRFQNLAQIEAKGAIGETMEYVIQFRAFSDLVYDTYDDEYPETVREEYGSSLSAGNPLDETVREIYLDILLDTMEIRLGKQQVVWGEAIGLRITDVVNPQDYRHFILDDFIDSRIPTWMARVNYFVDDWNIEMLWIPIFEPDREPLDGSNWVWTFNAIDTSTTVRYFEPEAPDHTLENSEGAIRMSGLIGGWNLSLNYLYVWDDAATRHINFNPTTFTLDVTRRYHRLPQWGFTFANAFGSFVPRGEISYAQEKRYNTANTAAEDGLAKKDYLHTMLGTDFSQSDITLTLQWIQKVIMDYEEGIYEPEIQTNYSIWIQANLMNETLKPELLAIVSPSDEGWVARPKVTYSLTDVITVAAGADLFSGPARSFFGQFNDNDQVYARFKYSF